jgi:hypothetical protein
VAFATQLNQGFDHGGNQVSTRTDRLGKDHIRVGHLKQFIQSVTKIVVVAAETTPGYLHCGQVRQAEKGSIDQVFTLVVGDHAYPLADCHQPFGSVDNGCCLTAAKETTYQV